MKLPAFQFYPGDWRKDTGVQSLDYEARGVWFEILCLMHESEHRGILTLNGKAMPDTALARLLGLTDDLLKQILTKIEAHGVASRDPVSGAMVCRRMVRDENLRKVRQNAGKQGGNPVLLKQKPTTHLKQKPTPSSSSSSSDVLAKPPAPRERNVLFDALAKAEESDPFQITKQHGSRIGAALAQIRQACPHLTPEEIYRRATNHRNKWPGISVTANSLASNWAKLGSNGATDPRDRRPTPKMMRDD